MVTGTLLSKRQGYAIRTLGEFCVFRGTDRMPLGQARERALLVYLAMGIGRCFQRDTLVDLLWDRGGTRQRRHGLSQLLYSLKRGYPLLELVRTRDTVRLGGGVSGVDALELLTAVDAGAIETACELFGGQFLEGFYIDAAGRFEEWRESMTRTLSGAASRALRARLARADAGGRWWIVERTANQLLELDPYDEQVHAARIRSIAADGGDARAVREIDRAVDLLRRDLGQLPGPELRELITRIGSGARAPEAEFSDPPAVGRFVGRTAEFRELRQAWNSVVEGRGVAIAVRGEAGIGKSRMCMQLLRVAAIEGGRVLDGRCFESASRVPYGGICQALTGIRDADFVLLAPHWRTALAALLPELSAAGIDPARTVELGAEGGRRQLFEAVVQLIKAMAQHSPVALFVDDLQWADFSTTDLLHYLTRALSEEPVLILVAVRPEELAPSELAKFVDGFRSLTIGPLEVEDAKELITTLDSSESRELPAGTLRKILQQSGGRPFLIVELVRYLGTRDAELQKRSDSTIDELPGAVEALLARRLRGLSEAAGDTVDVLAVLGGEATMTLLERAVRISSRELVAGLEELQYRQIIQETGSAYTFTHELMREAVERRLSTARRRWLNSAAASALQRMPRARLGAIALHMQAAGESASAYSYALQAASQSQSLFAHSETTFFLRLAVTTAANLDKRFVALDRLCRHLYSLADLPAVRNVLSELRPWYAGRRDRDGMLMAAVAELDSALYDGKSPATELRRRARALAELMDESLDTTESPAVGLILQTSQTAHDAGQEEFITTLCHAVHKRASRGPVNLNRVRHLSSASMAYGLYINASGGHVRAMTALRRAMEIADPASELVARLACGATGTLSGVYADAQHHFSRAWKLSADDALKHMRRQVIINHAVLLMEMGRFDEATKLLEDAIDEATIHDRVFLFGNLGLIGLEQRDWNGVSRSARELEGTNRVLQAWWARVAVSMLKGFAALGNGKVDQARDIASELSHMVDAGSEVVAGMLDSSYTNILWARVGLLGRTAEETAAALKRAADACRRTNVGAAARLDIERARTLKDRAPDVARDIACDVRQWALESGASVAAERATEILQEAQ